MTYIEGFVCAVPTANKEAYIKQAADAAPLFKEFGVLRHVECWGDDVPDGKLNDFKGAVQAKEDETVVFSWFEYPDRSTRDAASEKIMADPRMKALGTDMPFDGQRMIYAGFAPMLDQRGEGATGYVDGYILPVAHGNKDAYSALAQTASTVFLDHGAVRVVECWGDDVPDGKVTDYRRAAHAVDGENVVFSWVEWPSKDARTAGWEKAMADERLHPNEREMPFDGKRMIYGGFAPVFDA